jgi:transcriptional regulator with XRE-family HTH domain
MRTSTRRPRRPANDTALATRLGTRLKRARLNAGLTQQKLAGDRYTKAYVSALENGLVRPSMAALSFFAAQLGLSASALIVDEAPAWSRLEADVHLAAGRWQAAADAYTQLLDDLADAPIRPELLRGRAEALVRLNQALRATTDASEAVRLFLAQGRAGDAALATYWLAYAQFLDENTAEARSLIRELLDRVRAGLAVEPDFHVRLLVALSAIESREGDYAKALAYLQEVRGLALDLDDRRRASYLYDLAIAYRNSGDHEAGIRAGAQSLALYRASGAESDVAALENDLALAHLARGNLTRAKELVAAARAGFERLHDDRWLAHVEDTAAQIALADGHADRALALASSAAGLARETDNQRALTSSIVTTARAQIALGDMDAGLASFEKAAVLARDSGVRGQLRDILGQWADVLAKNGQHEKAYVLSREALSAG